MEHNISLITTLAAGFGLALVFGIVAERIRLPALVGYLFAGILIGPATPGFVADQAIASQLAEVGVMLLMFGVGLHFSLADLLAVKRIALPGAVVQMGFATVLGMLLAWAWGWPMGEALVFGLCLSCASTVVLLKALEARGILETMNGRIAVGWLVVEDLATVLMLVLLPPTGMSLVLAGALISIALNPFVFTLLGPASRWVLQRSAFARRLEQRDDPYAELPMSTERKYLEKQVVLVGHGRVGRRIAASLTERGIPFVVAEQNREIVEDLRARGVPAVWGNAAEPEVLVQAHVADAAMLVIATADTLGVRQMAETARALNPGIEIVLRSHSDDETALLRRDGVGTVYVGEEELAKGMLAHVTARFTHPPSA